MCEDFICFGRFPDGRALRSYCTGINHKAGIPACRQAGVPIANAFTGKQKSVPVITETL
ncbi:hypothetical protein [Mucilaginibacter sp. PPCGB 2223]|uniref:hypothetical protein n=1 Tax=Mucilaginibacter sp. PPCGB 2223 TaxID=1886027 RepID=UPI001586377B|nr:hypothetical protein [Mucilaginibacter sp. PPCGB 2223]